jgi:hypothetical protein
MAEITSLIEALERGLGVKTEVSSLVDDLEEAFQPLKGRTTDVRQQLSMDDSYRGTSPSGWLVSFPEDMYPSSETYLGPLPVVLVGHKDMSPGEFTRFLGVVHDNMYPQQVAQPVIATRAPYESVDLRRLVRGGDYDRSMEVLCPASHKTMERLLALLDDLLNHPLAHQSIRRIRESGVHSFSDLFVSLRRLADELDEPSYTRHTLGNVLDNLSPPFDAGSIF